MKVEIKKIINIAREAGDAILEIYQKDFEVYTKKDESPLTEADQAAFSKSCMPKTPFLSFIHSAASTAPWAKPSLFLALWLIVMVSMSLL